MTIVNNSAADPKKTPSAVTYSNCKKIQRKPHANGKRKKHDNNTVPIDVVEK